MTVVQNRGYAQEVLYSGFAGRVYGCSWLITSGTSNLAKTGYVERQSQAMRNGFRAGYSLKANLCLLRC